LIVVGLVSAGVEERRLGKESGSAALEFAVLFFASGVLVILFCPVESTALTLALSRRERGLFSSGDSSSAAHKNSTAGTGLSADDADVKAHTPEIPG